MKIELYKNFEHLKKYNNIWLYSDTHFGEKDMIKARQLTDEQQVKYINSKVGRKDVLILLGDVGNTETVKQLKGYKILVMGNHDSGASNYIKVFNEVYDGIVPLNAKIMLSHEPVSLSFMYNIHGHCHELNHKDDDKHFNVCAEHISYLPVNLTDIVKSGKLKELQSVHRLVIDKAVIRKKKKTSK